MIAFVNKKYWLYMIYYIMDFILTHIYIYSILSHLILTVAF